MKLFKKLITTAFVLAFMLSVNMGAAAAEEFVDDMENVENFDLDNNYINEDASGFDVDDRIVYRAGNTEIFLGFGYDDARIKENDNLRYLNNSLEERDILDYVSGNIGVKYMW